MFPYSHYMFCASLGQQEGHHQTCHLNLEPEPGNKQSFSFICYPGYGTVLPASENILKQVVISTAHIYLEE